MLYWFLFYLRGWSLVWSFCCCSYFIISEKYWVDMIIAFIPFVMNGIYLTHFGFLLNRDWVFRSLFLETISFLRDSPFYFSCVHNCIHLFFFFFFTLVFFHFNIWEIIFIVILILSWYVVVAIFSDAICCFLSVRIFIGVFLRWWCIL